MPMPPGVSILVCTHNRADLLARTLESCRQIQIPDAQIELVVVANVCTDNTPAVVADAAKSLPFPVRLVDEHALGLSAARNRAIRESTGDILAFLDDDVWVDPAWLVELLQTYRDFPADLVGGHVDLWWDAVKEPAWFSSGYQWILSGCDCGDKTFEMKDATGAIGANFSMKRKVFDSIGPFRIDLGRIGRNLMAGEETDYLYRALAAGFRPFHAPTVRVKHWVAPQRATPEYVAGAIAGFTRGHVMMKPRFGPLAAARSIGGNLFLLARHSLGRAIAATRGDSSAAVRHRVRMASSRGAISGAISRIFSSPAGKIDHPKASPAARPAATSTAGGN